MESGGGGGGGRRDRGEGSCRIERHFFRIHICMDQLVSKDSLKFGQKRNVRLKIVASGCDQCVWPVGVVAGCGHWVGH